MTFVLIAFFVIEGIVTIMYAIDHRAQLSGRWGWMLASGVVDLILAGIIFAGLPGTAAWALGLLVGINMVFGGTAMIGMALAAKEPALNIVIARSQRVRPEVAGPMTGSATKQSTSAAPRWIASLTLAMTATPPAAAPRAPFPRRWRSARSGAPRPGSRAR